MKAEEIGTEKGMQLKEDKPKEKKRRKIRRSKKIKNKLKKFKLMYVNIRGVKSKRRSLEEIVKEEKPTVIAITETLLEKTEELTLEQYEVLPGKADKGRGIMIAVRKELKTLQA